MAQPNDNKGAGSQSQMHPGDDAPPGTPGTGENICPTCKGSGKVGQKACPDCGGTGKVVEGIGGG
jgi:DnaJ-class molecular chaperone